MISIWGMKKYTIIFAHQSMYVKYIAIIKIAKFLRFENRVRFIFLYLETSESVLGLESCFSLISIVYR